MRQQKSAALNVIAFISKLLVCFYCKIFLFHSMGILK